MKKIKLTKGQFALVDDEDYDSLMKWKWCALWNPHTHSYYAVRKSRKGEFPMRRKVYMHEAIMGQKGIDHINHDTLNQHRSNLRPCTLTENNRNRRPNLGNKSSKYKGVCWHKGGKKWRANIWFDGKSRHLGLFENEISAAKAYDAAAKELFGEFAYLNFKE